MITKKLIPWIFVLACSATNAQTIRGKISNAWNNNLKLLYSTNGLLLETDTLSLAPDGSFSRTFHFSQMKMVGIIVSESGLEIPVFPDSKLTITADATDRASFDSTFNLTGTGAGFYLRDIYKSPALKGLGFNYETTPDSFAMGMDKWWATKDSVRKAMIAAAYPKGGQSVQAFLRRDSINDLYLGLLAMSDYKSYVIPAGPARDSFYKAHIAPRVIVTDKPDFVASNYYRAFFDRLSASRYRDLLTSPDSLSVKSLHILEYRMREAAKLPAGLKEGLLAIMIQQDIPGAFGHIPDSSYPYFDSITRHFGRMVPDPRVLANGLAGIERAKRTRIMTSKGEPAPSFVVQDSAGRQYTLKDFAGKYVYLDIWASWCAPCVAEIPAAKKMEEKFHGNKDIVFVSVPVDAGTKEWIEKGLRKHQPPGLQLWAGKGGWDSKFAQDYFLEGVPHYLLIDPEGKLVAYRAGRPSEPATTAMIESLLKVK